MENEPIVYIGMHLMYGESVMKRVQEDSDFKDFVNMSIGRYVMHDWGDADPVQCELNDQIIDSYALTKGEVVGIYTNYRTNDCLKVSTTEDMNYTTVLNYIKE